MFKLNSRASRIGRYLCGLACVPLVPLLSMWTAPSVAATSMAQSAASNSPVATMVAPLMSNAQLSIQRVPLGSGEQGLQGEEVAQPVGDLGVWHVPQYMPGFPSAATIWPRSVMVHCKNKRCDGFVITPEMGRGEYLYFVPTGE